MIGRRGSRRSVVIVSALIASIASAATVPLSASAGAPVLQTRWARYSFDGTGSGLLYVSGSVKIVPGAFFATVSVANPHSPKPAPFFPDLLDLDAGSTAGTYGALGDRDLCAGPVSCHASGGRLEFSLTFGIQGDGRHRLDLSDYIVIRGADPTIHDIAVVRWTARHRTDGVLRRTDESAGGAGVTAYGLVAGVNTGTSAPGPAAGSVALAVPACDMVGAGVLTLSGGANGATAVCPSDLIADVAKRGTTWTATGAVAGASNHTTRLLVIRA